MQDFLAAFNFLSDHIHLAGWVFIIGLVWKASRFVSKVSSVLDKAEDAASRSVKIDSTLQTLADNHLPHLQASIDSMGETLKDLHRDFVALLLSKHG